jgi:hypothetical protein
MQCRFCANEPAGYRKKVPSFRKTQSAVSEDAPGDNCRQSVVYAGEERTFFVTSRYGESRACDGTHLCALPRWLCAMAGRRLYGICREFEATCRSILRKKT